MTAPTDLGPVATTLEPSAAALRCHGVTVTFRDHRALDGVDLDVRPGEWLGLIGPNGAGKTTLLRSIAGLIDHGGRVTLADGRVPTATDLALVPQSPLLPTGMTVAEYVLLGRTAHLGWLARESRADREIAASVLRRLDLGRFAHRRVADRSGGEAQRVVVARALAQRAPMLLLDEPTSALDVGHQAGVLELVDELRRCDGLTVVAAMHDLSAAARFADRLVLLDHGAVIDDGPPRRVLEPERLSTIYSTPLTVRRIDGELVVLPGARRPHRPSAESA